MNLPNDVSPGQPVSAAAWNALLRYVRSLEVRGGPGVRVQRSTVGTTVSASIPPQGSAPVTFVHPFQVSDASAGVAAKVVVRSGSANDVIPTGVSPTEHTLTSAGTWRVYLDVTLNAAGAITAAAIGKTSGAQPANTNTHAYITLATVAVVAIDGGFAAGEITQLATHSLRFYACGRTWTGSTVTAAGNYNFWGF